TRCVTANSSSDGLHCFSPCNGHRQLPRSAQKKTVTCLRQRTVRRLWTRRTTFVFAVDGDEPPGVREEYESALGFANASRHRHCALAKCVLGTEVLPVCIRAESVVVAVLVLPAAKTSLRANSLRRSTGIARMGQLPTALISEATKKVPSVQAEGTSNFTLKF